MEIYNKNRDKNNGMHDEIREQNARMKDASFKDKLTYFKDYYLKSTLIILCIILFVASIIRSMVTGPSDTAFAAYFFNDTGDSSSTALADSFAEYMQIDTSEHEVYIDATLTYNDGENVDPTGVASGYDVYVNIQKTMAMIAAKDLDVIVCDQNALVYFEKAECFADIRTLLSSEQIARYADRIYYYHNEETNEDIPVGIYIQDAPRIAENYYYYNKDAVLSFIVNSENLDNAVAFLDYIFMTE